MHGSGAQPTSHAGVALELPASYSYVLSSFCFSIRFRGQGLPMTDNGGGWNAPKTIEAYQGVLIVDQDEVYGKWE